MLRFHQVDILLRSADDWSCAVGTRDAAEAARNLAVQAGVT